MSIRKLATFALALMASAGAASAAPLGLVPTHPDTMVSFASGQYGAGTDTLTIHADAGTFTPNGIDITDDFIGEFNLTAKIDGLGNLVPDAGNTFSIVEQADLGNILKLSGNLTAFGFSLVPGQQMNTAIYEFKFQPTGGQYLASYGSQGGMILKFAVAGETGMTFGDDFRFTNPGNSTGDVFAVAVGVPVPAALPAGLFLLGATVVVRIRKRRMAN